MLLNVLRDVVSTFSGIPTSTAEALVSQYQERKARELRDLLFEEIEEGHAPPFRAASEDEAVEICIRLIQCSEAGSARINLRLLLKVLRGLSATRPIYASEFARFQTMLAGLTREEIIVIATLHRETQHVRSRSVEAPVREAWLLAEQKLVPAVFKTPDHMRATAYSAQRSGLLMGKDDWDSSGYLLPSPLLEEVAQIASLDEALEAEGLG